MEHRQTQTYKTIYWGPTNEDGRSITELMEQPSIFRNDPYQRGWSPIPDAIRDWLCSEVDEIDGKYAVNALTTAMSQVSLPFYKNVRLIRLADGTWDRPDLAIYFLVWGRKLFRLNGMSTPIHDLNHKRPIKLTEDTVLDYLRFFCHFVHGEKGPFLLAESMTQAFIPDTLEEQERTIVSDNVTPVSFNGMTPDNKYECSGIVMYGQSLFFAKFHVYPNGLIEMTEDEPIAGDLKVKVRMELS